MSYNGPLPQVVNAGGTGDSSLTAYSVLCGGTTSTGAVQSVASVGSSGQVLTSNGAGALPTFQAAGGGGAITLIQSQNASTQAVVGFTTGLSSYKTLFFIVQNALIDTNANGLTFVISTNGGSSYASSGYLAYEIRNVSGNGYAINAHTSSYYVTGGTPTNKPMSGVVYFWPATGLMQAQFQYYDSTASEWSSDESWGYCGSTSTNAYGFSSQSGNVTSGTFSVYGISS